jgi:predicted transcriptional regulator of viral defense system
MPDRGRETGTHGPFLDQQIASIASRQHAVISLEQLASLGLTDSAARKRAAAGRLHRIYAGVYSLVPRELLPREGRWMAAVLACGPGAVLSHRAAAALHELRRTDRTGIDVTVPRRSSRAHVGIDVHRSTNLTSVDVTIVNGIPCTTFARTLFDLTEVVNRRQAERAFDQADVMEVLDLRAIEDQLERNPKRAAASRVRSILDEHYIGTTLTDSELEEVMFALCRRISVPQPLVNRWVDLHDGEPPIKADFLWPEQRVIVETDGRRFHGTHQALERDPRRDQRAILAGWTPIRTTWRQVMNRPHELEQTIVRLVAAPPRSRPRAKRA